jgi:F0F1-type ATP synthase assembly protein I
MEEQAGNPWGMIIGIAIGVGLGFLAVWGAWKMMPYMYNLLFPARHEAQEPTSSNEEESAS